MSPSARKSDPTRELLRQVATRSTGRLIADVDPERIEIFLMNGDIVGAVTRSDEARLLEQAEQRGLLPQKRISELTVVLSGDHSIFGPLLDEIPPAEVDPLLFDRFRENLLAFVGAQTMPVFEAMPGVFVDNMQMGHVSATLIEWATRHAELAAGIELDVDVALTPAGQAYAASQATDAERDVLQRAASSLTVDDLIQATPGEPTILRSTIARLIEQGALELQTVALAPVYPVPPPDDEDADDTDAPTMIARKGIADELPLAQGVDADFLDDPTYDGDMSEVFDDPPEYDDDSDIDRVEHVDQGSVSPISPQDLAMWLDTGEGVDEDDLAFFEDHEDDRGQGAGGFSTETHNLDKVEVGKAREPEPVDEDVLEAGEATTTKYGAPVLSDSEASDKIEVLNDVLRRVSEAFDEAAGAGRGPAAVQLLVDGAPAKYSAILHDLSIDETGEVPAEDILGNLASRPLSEQRLVLNGALKDLIDRALSTAADELPEEVFDELYESVAGYNTRLGI